MPDRILNLNQQIALLPASIPDTVLDFLEDFQSYSMLETESSRSAFDPEYLKTKGDGLRDELEKLRKEFGKLLQLQVDAMGREIPGGFLLKLSFEKSTKGLGLLTRQRERTIQQVVVQAGDYNEEGLKDLLKKPLKPE